MTLEPRCDCDNPRCNLIADVFEAIRTGRLTGADARAAALTALGTRTPGGALATSDIPWLDDDRGSRHA